MHHEISIFAFLVPGLLVVLLVSTVVFVGIDLLLARVGTYRHVWHPSLFRASLFVALFCAASLLTRAL
jgi:hypothetical protein